MTFYLEFMVAICYLYDIPFTLLALDMTWIGHLLTTFLWIVDIFSLYNLILAKKRKSELKYTGVCT